MLYLKLRVPVITRSMLKQTADALGLTVDTVEKIWAFARYIDIDDKGNETILGESETEEYEKNSGRTRKDYGDHIGVEGLLWYAEKKGIEIPYLKELDINKEVYYEEKKSWDDICHLFVRVEMRMDRLINLLDMGAPDVIIHNEKRMFYECVSALEDNRRNPVTWNDGRPVISLKDIGYSLIDAAWEPEKKKQLEEEFEAFSRKMEALQKEHEDETEDDENVEDV